MKIEQKFALVSDTSEISLSEVWSGFSPMWEGAPALFDHDQDLLIFSTVEHAEVVRLELEAQLLAPVESLHLLLLPSAMHMRKEFTDYGFISHSNQIYGYADNIFLFTVHSEDSQAQPYQALEQMEEHLLASCSENGLAIYLTDHHSDELMLRIARAYHCSIEALHL
ncbi:hypothetical protein [Paenibacillus sp. 1_12]|uniref:hypothetical protein n=1 Tax=Paenibacillus sp. 1_12 TaxID=1566278 RepID=UPI001160D689|nr:hypothetical protein [Paenibacillus sp. 1_12]